MKIAITGSTGLVGEQVVSYFNKKGHEVTRIVRSATKVSGQEATLQWNIQNAEIERDKLEGQDIIIHLAGANIADKRWTPQYKELIRSSRVDGTSFLAKTITQLNNPPKVLFSASAIGYYGTYDNDQNITEQAPKGNDFLANVCDQWEQATHMINQTSTRIVHLRIGMIVSATGGAVKKMLPIFKLGLGGNLGSGQQIISWICIDEISRIIEHIYTKDNLSGAVNIVAPETVSNAGFTQILGKAIKRPTFFPVPAFGAKILFGEMADALLLSGANVVPQKLMDSGYQFQYPTLQNALEICLSNDW